MNDRPNVFPSQNAAMEYFRQKRWWSRYYQMQQLKLTFELVPVPLHRVNLRSAIGRQKWDDLRRLVYTQFDHQCGICGSPDKMICHEVWDYDDINHIQTLTGFIALCELCDRVKHFGLAQILAREGKLDLKPIIQHFCEVNQCNESQFMMYKYAAFFVHAERSKHEWVQSWGQYEHLRSGIDMESRH
jgi:hypothetical protein